MNPTRSPFRTIALSALAATALSACASPSSLQGLRPTQSAVVQEQDPGDASVYGLYLAGEAAIDRGSSRDAAFYFAKASALDPSSDAIRTRAFTSALVAGEVDVAARIAAEMPAGTEPVEGLGRLTRAVDALAQDHGAEATTLLSGAPFPLAHAGAAALLKPWAAAEAGDWKSAEAVPAVGANPVLATVAALGRAEILEREGKLPDAEQAFKARANAKNGLFILGYAGFLERRGRYADAVALYDKALKDKPTDLAFVRAKARAAQHSAPPPLPTVKEGAAEALIAPAVFMMAQHQGDSGLGYLRLALRLDDKLDEAWVLVGDAMTAAGQLVEATVVRLGAAELTPGMELRLAIRDGRLFAGA